MVLEQLHHTIMHDSFCEHLQLKELPNELDVPQRASPGLVPGIVQLLLQASSLLGLWTENGPKSETPFHKELALGCAILYVDFLS